MHPAFVTDVDATDAVPIWFASTDNWVEVRGSLAAGARDYADAVGFEPIPGSCVILPGEKGMLGGVLLGVEPLQARYRDRFLAGLLPERLPKGTYRFANAANEERLACLAFALGGYRFGQYRPTRSAQARLVLPAGVNGHDLSRIAEAVVLARDLVNTPANDMGPAELEQAARALGEKHSATVSAIEGDALLEKNYPLVYAVGRGAARPPRLIDLAWGDEAAPRITIVGKGVCFDTGGLNIKPEERMRIMKKDMGGAATALALAHMIMDRGLKVRLRVLIPAVENSISGAAYRPLDVYRSRAGISVEIGHTDSEGRLILADALTAAAEEKPDLLVDLATLTGAARTALGPDLAAFYTDDDQLAANFAACAAGENDPAWRLPLWPPYCSMLDSKVADINNDAPPNMAGSITAALFLQRFVPPTQRWLHLDIFAWNPTGRPGRPQGGDCHAARALYSLIGRRYG
jgi:leucyl aminopeptidase